MLLVVVAVVQHAGRILMVQEAKARALGMWNLPGGRVEPGEGLAAAMLREIQEEAGVSVALRGLLFADQVLAGGAAGGPRMRFVFMAEPLTYTLKSHPDEHSLQAQWFSRNDLPGLPLRNPHVIEMIDLAAEGTALLPMSSVRARVGDLPTSR